MNAVLLSLLGAVILLDKYALGEFGISQPVVTGMIIGALFGDMWFGIFLGAMVQLIFLGGLPIGRDIPPDGQAAGIVTVTAYFLLRESNSLGHSLFVASVLGLLGGIVGGFFDIVARRFNEKLYHHFMLHEECLYICHGAGLLTAFGRGLLLFLIVFVFADLFVIPDVVPQITKETLTIIGICLGLANGLYLFVKVKTVVFLLIGGVCGLALVVF
ncbi:MAG: PTS sugar transporter subunit IIC [candidate division WOR-3 bacterium]|nr:MAG: PTS sugar transporter subunit IIC [candidate division WOR-3 bacterium]